MIRSWRLAIRLARREALRARGRSLLVLVMVALPVLAVTAADVVLRTQDVDGVESLSRRLGSAQALVTVPAGGRPVIQAFDPYDGNTSAGGGRGHQAPTAGDLSAALGGARLVAVRSGETAVRVDDGVTHAEATEVDLRDPLTRGLFDLTSGRWPRSVDEVVANRALLDEGYRVGDRLDLAGRESRSPIIVGAAESTTVRDYPVAAGPDGSLGVARSNGEPSWLAGGGPVGWDAVRALNALGATVLSRAVVEDPPPASEVPAEIRSWSAGSDNATIAVVVLVAVMALLEVVLLAGPAFAVSARRQSRDLALIAAAGGTPRQSRRVLLAGGVVLGGVASVAGVLLGIGAGWALVPAAQHWSGSWFGPFDVPWLHLVGIAAFGLLSAVLAAVAPAWIASRQNVVAVLAGRRADRGPSLRSPVLGMLLLGAGVAGAAYGAHASRNGEFAIAGSAVVAVLGTILLVPVVVVGLARVSGRFPLAPRYAVRDAARHRTRTVPAVAAVAATVAGVVALGIGVTSDEAESEATYTPTLPMGVAAVGDYARSPRWQQLRGAVTRYVPGADVTSVVGVPEGMGTGYVELRPRRAGAPLPLDTYGGSLGSALIVDDGSGVQRLPGLPASATGAARRVLAAGGVVVFTTASAGSDAEGPIRTVAVVEHRGRREPARTAATVPGLAVHVGPTQVGPRAILSPGLAGALALPTRTVGLLVDGTTITAEQESAVQEAVAAVSRNASFHVERGYQPDDATVIAQFVLAGLGAVLMLGGTLTATFLALSDARPDLATLSAVGASPRRRRGIAASYALVVGLVGAVLGAAVGFVPGIAVTYPLTSTSYGTVLTDGSAELSSGPYLDVPWLLVIGVVLGLPLLTAALVGLTARSRLPLVARLP